MRCIVLALEGREYLLSGKICMNCGFGGKIIKICNFVVCYIANHLSYSAMINFGTISDIQGLIGLIVLTKLFYFANISLGTDIKAKSCQHY